MDKYSELPNGYTQIYKIDLQKNKKVALLLNSLSLLICATMIFLPISFSLFPSFYDTMLVGKSIHILAKGATIFIGIIIYIFLHEWTHGICMRYFSTLPVHYGLTTLYAYGGSNAYFNKKNYIIIALAPLFIWGIILTIINMLVPVSWFWVVYLIQIINLTGGIGDLYVTWKLIKMPSDILIQDNGVSMAIYSQIK